MATFSPRCVQQLDRSQPTDPIPMKTTTTTHLSTSPYSSITAPSSYDSDFESKSTLIPSISNHQFSTLPSPSTSESSSLLIPSTSNNKNIIHNSQNLNTSHKSLLTTNCHQSNSWVAKLLSTKFYGPCPTHINLRKNDQNLFCITHSQKICQYCHNEAHSTTPSCTILHVSRYMYHDVLLAREASTLLDVAEVQSYLNNGNRVIYIDRRAQPKSKLAPNAKSCSVCSRTLQDPYRFCSLFCRLQYANDPAADETVPVPDASPLVNQTIKKIKKVQEFPFLSNKIDKSTRKIVDNTFTFTNKDHTFTPCTILMISARKTYPLNYVNNIRKNRRKGKPIRSPLGSSLG